MVRRCGLEYIGCEDVASVASIDKWSFPSLAEWLRPSCGGGIVDSIVEIGKSSSMVGEKAVSQCEESC
jgi:hypothetical protein